MIINGFKSKASALRFLNAKGHKINTLLSSPESNPKVAKNGKVDVLASPMHLAPYNLSGFQVCAQASDGCAAACLHTAGNPVYMEHKAKSRKAKTRAYFQCRDAWLAVLAFEIMSLERKAIAKGMVPAIRLNATSDLPFERRKVTIDGVETGLMEAFPDVQFYDYTKITKRAIAWAKGNMPANYHLTFSRNEDNDSDVTRVLEAGGNVTIVFDHRMHKATTEAGVFHGLKSFPWEGVQTIDGDTHDYRPADPVGCIVALKAKGDAKTDTSGFVIR